MYMLNTISRLVKNLTHKIGMHFRDSEIASNLEIVHIPKLCGTYIYNVYIYIYIYNVLRQWSISLIPTYRVYRLYDIRNVYSYCEYIRIYIYIYTVFPRIDRVRTIYFSALIGAQTNRGRGLLL